jgi:hypothetical protein
MIDKEIDVELRSSITFELVHEKEIRVLRNGEEVGKIWSWIPKNDFREDDMYPYSEKEKDYVEKNGIQICGFSKFSTVWDNCGKFEGKKDVVLVFKKNKI